jgi:hypothetical protein
LLLEKIFLLLLLSLFNFILYFLSLKSLQITSQELNSRMVLCFCPCEGLLFLLCTCMYNMHMCMYHMCTFMCHLCTCLYMYMYMHVSYMHMYISYVYMHVLEEMGFYISHDTTCFVCFVNPTTCFGLYFRPSSGHKIYVIMLEEIVQSKSRTQVYRIKIQRDLIICLTDSNSKMKDNEISLNFNSICLSSRLTLYSFF